MLAIVYGEGSQLLQEAAHLQNGSLDKVLEFYAKLEAELGNEAADRVMIGAGTACFDPANYARILQQEKTGTESQVIPPEFRKDTDLSEYDLFGVKALEKYAKSLCKTGEIIITGKETIGIPQRGHKFNRRQLKPGQLIELVAKQVADAVYGDSKKRDGIEIAEGKRELRISPEIQAHLQGLLDKK